MPWVPETFPTPPNTTFPSRCMTKPTYFGTCFFPTFIYRTFECSANDTAMDWRDFVMGELVFELTAIKKRLAQSQQLNGVLERHCHHLKQTVQSFRDKNGRKRKRSLTSDDTVVHEEQFVEDVGDEDKLGSGSDSDVTESEPSSSKARPSTSQLANDDVKPFKCDFEGCPITFASLRSKKRHFSSIHSGEKFHCGIDDCSQVFSRKDYLIRHQRRHHLHR